MKFDNIYDTWVNINDTYKKYGSGMSPKEFLIKMLGKNDSIISLKKLAASDFIETQENIKKSQDLFNQLEQTKKRMYEVSKIDDIAEFVWASADEVETEQLEITDSLSLMDCIEMCRINVQPSREVFNTVFRLDRRTDKIECIDMKNSESVLRLNTAAEMVTWVKQKYTDEKNFNEFEKVVYTYLLNINNENQLELPVTFIDSNVKTKIVPQPDEIKHIVKLTNGAKLVNGKRLSINGEALVCSINTKYCGKQSVVMITC